MGDTERQSDAGNVPTGPNPFIHCLSFLAERPSHGRGKELLSRIDNLGGLCTLSSQPSDPILPLCPSKYLSNDEADSWRIFPFWSKLEAFLQGQREKKVAGVKRKGDQGCSSAETTPKRQKLSCGMETSTERVSGRRPSTGALLDIRSEGRTGWRSKGTPSADEVEGWKYLSRMRNSYSGVKQSSGFLRDDVDEGGSG